MVFAQLLQTANIFNNQRCANCVSRFRRVTWSVYILLKSFSTCNIESKFPFIDLKVLGGHLSKIWTTLLRHFQPFCDEAIKWKAIALIYGMYGFIKFHKHWFINLGQNISTAVSPVLKILPEHFLYCPFDKSLGKMYWFSKKISECPPCQTSQKTGPYSVLLFCI